MSENREIERKFLVLNDSYKSLAVEVKHIKQGYLCREKGRVVRIRVSNDKGYITIKSSAEKGSISRFEWEKEIALEDAEQLLQLCLPVVIEKDRYIVPNGDTTVEVDQFHGSLEGLVFAEIELPSEDYNYYKPDFLGEEVTHNKRYSNAHLSRTINPLNNP